MFKSMFKSESRSHFVGYPSQYRNTTEISLPASRESSDLLDIPSPYHESMKLNISVLT